MDYFFNFKGPLSIYTQPDPSIKRLENTSAKAGVATQAKGSKDPNCDLDKLFTLGEMLNSSKRLRKPDLRSQGEFLADIFERRSRSAGSLSSNGDGMSPGTHKNQAGVSQFWYKENRDAAMARRQREQTNRRNALKYDKDVERVINFAKLGKLHDIKRMLQEGRVRDIDAHGKEGITALHAAAMSLNVRVMEYLIKNGASPKKTDILGRDIHSLIRVNKTSLPCALSYGRSILFLRIKSGTAANDVTHENHNRWLLDRALTVVSTESVFKAAQDGNEERLRWLLEAGINQANDRNRHSMSALHYAMMNNHKACSMLLIDFGANPNLENSLGQTPLQVMSKVLT